MVKFYVNAPPDLSVASLKGYFGILYYNLGTNICSTFQMWPNNNSTQNWLDHLFGDFVVIIQAPLLSASCRRLKNVWGVNPEVAHPDAAVPVAT